MPAPVRPKTTIAGIVSSSQAFKEGSGFEHEFSEESVELETTLKWKHRNKTAENTRKVGFMKLIYLVFSVRKSDRNFLY